MITFALTAIEELGGDEPISYYEAVNSKQYQNWIATMNDELNSLNKNGTWGAS